MEKETDITRLILKEFTSCGCFAFKDRADLPGISECYPGQGALLGLQSRIADVQKRSDLAAIRLMSPATTPPATNKRTINKKAME